MIEGQPSPAEEGVISVSPSRVKQPMLHLAKPVVLQKVFYENNETKRLFCERQWHPFKGPSLALLYCAILHRLVSRIILFY